MTPYIGTLAGLLGLATVAAQAQTAPDLILYDARVIVFDDAGTEPPQAVAITGNRVSEIGADTTLLELAGPETETIDLDGATLVPGMIDNHVHYVRAAGGSEDAVRAIAASLNAAGITSIIDAGGFNFTENHVAPVRALDDTGELDLRVFQMKRLPAEDPDAARAQIAGFSEIRQMPGDGLAQGAGVGETLYLPLHDSTSRPFEPTEADTETATALLMGLAENDLALHLHTYTDPATQYFLDLFESATPGAAARLGWTFHHLNGATPETIGRMAEAGVHAAVHPIGDLTADLDGETSLRPPVGLMEEQGIVWGLGTDGGRPQPLFSRMAWASGDGGPEGAANTVSRVAALRAVTLNNAVIAGRGDDLGSIDTGKIADLAVLDRDVTDPTVNISDTRVLMTLVDGRIVHREGL